MIKVLRVITRLNIGGPAIHTILLSSELNKSGRWKDILVCGKISESEGDMAYLAREKGLEPIVVPDMGRDISFVKDLKAFFAILSIIRRERPDIVHTHTAKAGTIGRCAAILAGVPIKIHTFHGHIFDGYFNPAKVRIFTFIEKFLGLFTDRVITVSDRVKADIVDELRIVDNAKSAVIPLGLELDRFLASGEDRGIFRKKLGLSGDTLLVGIVGRLVPIKNHKMFLDAARRIVETRPGLDVKFLVIGDGELRGDLEKYAIEAGLKEKVLFTGWIEDLASVYADLDIVALTSLNEGTPVSLIEALASGKTVISTAVGGVGDIIIDGKNGILAESNNAGAFADKLLALLGDEAARLALSRSGREYVRERYSKDRLVRDIVELYEDCVSRKKAKMGQGN